MDALCRTLTFVVVNKCTLQDAHVLVRLFQSLKELTPNAEAVIAQHTTTFIVSGAVCLHVCVCVCVCACAPVCVHVHMYTHMCMIQQAEQ